MKKILLFALFTMFFTSSYAQDMPIKELMFSTVIQSESGADKTKLYAALRSFVATYYHNSKEVIQMDDKDAGILICKATSLFDSPSIMLSAYEGWLDYNLKLQARDGRIRIEVSRFFHHNKPGNQAKAQLGVLTTAEEYTNTGMQKKYHNKIWEMLKKHAEDISNDIFAGVEEVIKENIVTDTQEEEW